MQDIGVICEVEVITVEGMNDLFKGKDKWGCFIRFGIFIMALTRTYLISVLLIHKLSLSDFSRRTFNLQFHIMDISLVYIFYCSNYILYSLQWLYSNDMHQKWDFCAQLIFLTAPTDSLLLLFISIGCALLCSWNLH